MKYSISNYVMGDAERGEELESNVAWLVGFNGISTLVGYLMPNPVYTYIKFILFVYRWFLRSICKCVRPYFLAVK